jgi:hypothetical protein
MKTMMTKLRMMKKVDVVGNQMELLKYIMR